MPREQTGVRLAQALAPIEARALEARRILGVGRVRSVPALRRQLAAAALRDGARELRIAVGGEIQKGGARAPLLALEEQGDERREQHQARRHAQARRVQEMGRTLPGRAVPHLVVVLEIGEEALKLVSGESVNGIDKAEKMAREVLERRAA